MASISLVRCQLGCRDEKTPNPLPSPWTKILNPPPPFDSGFRISLISPSLRFKIEGSIQFSFSRQRF